MLAPGTAGPIAAEAAAAAAPPAPLDVGIEEATPGNTALPGPAAAAVADEVAAAAGNDEAAAVIGRAAVAAGAGFSVVLNCA